jgi:hypothetical protein
MVNVLFSILPSKKGMSYVTYPVRERVNSEVTVTVRVTVVAKWAKAPGIHCYVAGSIPAVTPRYCTKKIEKCSLEHNKKKQRKGIVRYPMLLRVSVLT